VCTQAGLDDAGDLPVPSFTVMRIVAPFGFYSAGNIGDEATLKGFARLMAVSGVSAQVSIGSRNPAHTSEVEPSFRYFGLGSWDLHRFIATARSNAQAIIGGTPIMDILGEWPLSELTPLVRSSDRKKIPMAFIGVGTETLRSEHSRSTVAEVIAPRVRHWSVRCERDYDRLVEYGVPAGAITVAADMAWLIETSPDGFGRDCLRQWVGEKSHPLIGVNLVNEDALFTRQPRFVDEVARALDQLASDMDARIIFLANEVRPDYDRAAALEIMSRMKQTRSAVLVPNQYFTPWQMMSIISCCDLTVSMRYHFCMFSALQEVPFVALERSDKVSDLCWDINWPASLVPSKLESSDLVAHVRRLMENVPEGRGHLRRAVQKMRERAQRNTKALVALAEA
jgi:polysaccharide pyruvyl transferase WcaK-like protein